MIRFIRAHLQVRLILAFVLVMLIPTGLVSSYNLLRTRATLLSQINSEYLRIAQVRASVAAARLSEGSSDLRFVLRSAALRHYAQGESNRLIDVAGAFKDFLWQSGEHYSGLCLLSPAGLELVCVRRNVDGDVQRVPAEELHNCHGQPYVAETLAQDNLGGLARVTISGADPIKSLAGMLHYAAALTPDEHGVRAGMVVLEVPLAPILATLIDPTDGVRTSVLDRNGDYLYHPAVDLLGYGQLNLSREQPHDAAVILGREAGTISESADRPNSFQVFTRVRPSSESALQWTVVYQRPYADALSLVRETELVNAAITLLALVLALALAYFLARGIVRPIRALAAAAERIGDGDLGASLPHRGNDEIGALGDTLARTVSRLQESLLTAEGQRNEAETLRATTQALGATLDLERVLELILTELGKVVPFDSASVQEVRGDVSRIIGSCGHMYSERLLGATFPLQVGVTPNAEVARTCLPVILHDAPLAYAIFGDEQFRLDPIRSWLGVPMMFGERLIGMITLDKNEPGYFTAEHARLAAAFASQSAAAIENARLYEAARREIEDRRRAEAAQARLVEIIEATTDLVGMADVHGRVLFLNQAGRQMLGIPLDAPLDQLYGIDLFPPHRHSWVYKEAVPAAIQDGAWSGEGVVIAQGGTEIPVSQVIIAHKGSDGRLELLSTIVRDMREQRRAEEDLRQAQKMEALGRFAGGMAHDFNNLLTVILGEAELLLDDLPRSDPMRPMIDQIRQSGLRAAGLTRQLLAFSRRQVLQPELLDLNLVIAGMEQLLRRLIGEDITLSVSLDPQLPQVRADQGQIEQVVMNLALNARDAMPAGGRLLIKTLPSTLDEEAGRHEEGVLATALYAMITVSDTGLGMDEQTRDHLFEPFFTTKPRGKGTGLGLATVHGIIRQSGGQIWFDSAPGHGTTFKIYLPAVDEPPPVSDAAGPSPEAERDLVRATTVLLVEDDVDVRRLAQQILTRYGFSVLEAGDGATALALGRAHTGPISLLLTDVVMPGGLNGVQLAAAFRVERPDTRVVYMSGYTDNALVDRSIAEEDASFIQKPFTSEALMRVLLAALT